MRYQLQITGAFGDSDGGWRPAIRGDMHEADISDEYASTSASENKAYEAAKAHHIDALPASRWRVEPVEEPASKDVVSEEADEGEPVGCISRSREDWVAQAAASSGGAILADLPYEFMPATRQLIGPEHLIAIGHVAAERPVSRDALLAALSADQERCVLMQLRGASASLRAVIERLGQTSES